MAETEPTPSGQPIDATFWAGRKSKNKRRNQQIQPPPQRVQSFHSDLGCGCGTC